MSYQVIARKYRPQRFSDVVGQGHVTQTLANAIQQNRIAHAYLFVGPRGTGKTTLARIFAKCLNATGGPRTDFAEDDPRCREIAEGRSLDVLEIDGASNRGIEEIRELRETVKYAPACSKFKIYIIDEVHMLTKEAFNALLKTLEEPPEHVKFMFATTEPEKVLPTILSRCQRFDLRRIPASLIAKHLTYIAGLEKVEVEEAALYAIARGAEGGMRDAESALDQLISFCGDKIVESDVLAMFGLAARSQILGLASALVAGDAAAALRDFNDLANSGKDLGRLLGDLLRHFRNLLLFQVSKGDLSLLEVSEIELTNVKEQSANLAVDSLTRVMEVFADCESRLKDAASKKILIEVALLRAIEARNAVSIDTVLRRLQELRSEPGRTGASVPAAPARLAAVAPARLAEGPAQPRPTPAAAPGPSSIPDPASVEPSIVAPRASAGAGAGSLPQDRSQLLQLWARIIEDVGRVSPFAKTYLLEAHPVSFAKNVLTIGFDPEFADHLGLVDNSKNRTLIQTKLSELGYREAQVKFIESEAPADWTRPVPAPEPPAQVSAAGKSVSTPAPEPKTSKAEPASLTKEDFKNDPLIRQALEIFKGTIVEVRA